MPDESSNEPRSHTPLHTPVMLSRVVALLSPSLTNMDGVVLDATLGMGGHSQALLEQFPNVRLIGIDRDPSALSIAAQRLAAYSSRTTLVHAIYDEIPQVLADLATPHVNGVLMDLGVSSVQLDQRDRGFAYSYDAPLDMRMDGTTTSLTAADVVNTYPTAELARVLRMYGDERFARRIAEAVVRERERQPVTSTQQLVDLIRAAVPAAAQRTGGHPAKRTFQALRIEVNNELSVLERALPRAISALALHGRIVVLAYQSLEDRIVKRSLRRFTVDDVPSDFPIPGSGPELRILTRGAEQATPEEVEQNPRAKPVRMRAAERLRVAA